MVITQPRVDWSPALAAAIERGSTLAWHEPGDRRQHVHGPYIAPQWFKFYPRWSSYAEHHDPRPFVT